MRSKIIVAILFLAIFLLFSHASASVIKYDELNTFLIETGAKAETPLPKIGKVRTPVLQVGDLNISKGPNAEIMWTWDYSDRIGGYEIGLTGGEDLDIELSDSIYSFGFQTVEPDKDYSYSSDEFQDSTFMITLFDKSDAVGFFEYETPNDIASFIGVWSDKPFDKVEIREIIGGNDNEFFGQFYTGSNALITDLNERQPIPNPEPGTFILLGTGIFGIAAYRLRRKKK